MFWERSTRSTQRITECDTAQTERILARLVITARFDGRSVSSHEKRNNKAQYPCIASVPSCVVEPRVARTLSVVLEPTLRPHHIEPRVQLTCREKNHPLFHKIYIIERNSSEQKYTMRVEDWRTAKTSEAKTNSIEFGIAGKGGSSVLCYNFAQEFVPMKRS